MQGFKFDGTAFSHAFIGIKARRWIGAFFEGVGGEEIVYAIQNNKNLLDYIPPAQKAEWVSQAQQFVSMFAQFTDEEVYRWIPANWAALIKSVPGGNDWALNQIKAIRVAATTNG
jgi:hypothetical protein